MSKKFRRRADSILLVGFRQFACDAKRAFRKVRRTSGESLQQTMRRLEKEGRSLALSSSAQLALATSTFHRQKTAEIKWLRWKSAADQRREDCARTRHDGEREATLAAGAQQTMPGITHAWQPGIRDDRDLSPGGQLLDQFRCPSRFVVLMIADERLADLEVREEMTTVAGVFAGNEIDVSQNLDRPQGHVAEIPDGCGDEIEHGKRLLCASSGFRKRRSFGMQRRVCSDTQAAMRAMFPMLFAVLAMIARACADDATAKPNWNLTVECQMVTLPQALALPLVEELSDDLKIEPAWTRLQRMIAKGEAKLVANLVGKSEAGKNGSSESVQEFRYPTEFDPPQLPSGVPPEKIAETLKSWPVVGITPTAFATRNLGAMLQFFEGEVSADGKWILLRAEVQHVRLLRFDKYDGGLMPSGERLAVEQPRLMSLKNSLKLRLADGQRVLAGVHKLPDQENILEFFILRVSARKSGATE
jgi:hypothetical protein